MLYRNARQLLNTVQSTFPGVTFAPASLENSCASSPDSGIQGAQCAWFGVLQDFPGDDSPHENFKTLEASLLKFCRIAQDLMSSTASNYDVSRLSMGLLVTTMAALLVLPTIYRECRQSAHTGIFLAFLIIGYGSMMFASSYVEEEQQFWYWICSGWMFYLHTRYTTNTPSSGATLFSLDRGKFATFGFAIAHRLTRRWNQTGQKFAAEPDIARTFFPAHPMIFWTLFLLTYTDAGIRLSRNLPSTILKIGGVVLTALACVFKLNFVANDSPELLVDTVMSKIADGWPASASLVLQARLIFGGLVCCAVLATMVPGRSNRMHGEKLSLP